MTSRVSAEVDDTLIGCGTSACESGPFRGDRKWSHWQVGFGSGGNLFTIVIIVQSFFLLPPFLFNLMFFFSPLFFPSRTPQCVGISKLEYPQMCKLLRFGFVDSSAMPGFPVLIRGTRTCWTSFLVSPVAPEGFFGLRKAFEMPCKVLGLGGHPNLDVCVE